MGRVRSDHTLACDDTFAQVFAPAADLELRVHRDERGQIIVQRWFEPACRGLVERTHLLSHPAEKDDLGNVPTAAVKNRPEDHKGKDVRFE